MMSRASGFEGEPAVRYAWRAALLTATVTLVGGILYVFLVRSVLGLDFEALTESPLAPQRRHSPRYAGFLGSLALFGWAAAAALSGLTARVLSTIGSRSSVRFAAASAAFSVVLLLNEGFAIHHTVAPELLGIPKLAVLAIIVLVTLLWVAFSWHMLARDPDSPIILWAVGWLALSLAIDVAGEMVGWGGVREETAKLIGMTSWVIFHWRYGRRMILAAIPEAPR
jgi:hypothetical protein